MRLHIQEPLCVHENVPAFCVDILSKYLGKLYAVQTLVVDGADLENPCRRLRRLTVLVHKQYATVPLKGGVAAPRP